MARLEVTGLDQLDKFLNGLSDLCENIDDVAKDCIDAASPTLEKALKSNIKQAANRMDDKGRKYSTGELARSITPTKAKTNAYGNFAAICPVGTDKKGVRNGEKLAYLEYGTSKQEAHPVMEKSLAQAEPQTKEIIQKRFEEHVNRYMK